MAGYDGSLKFDTEISEKGFNSGITKLGSLAKGGLSVLAGAIGSVTAALGAGVVTGLKYNASIETYQTSFEVMTGSAEKAAEVIDRLKKVGAETPFELPELADTTQLLMNYGFTADEAMDKMMMLGDISQGSADKMSRIAMAYGQMSSAGKVSLEDVKQMIEAGFNPLQEISESTGESMESLYDRISKGTLSVDEITASMERATSEGGKYYQSMQKQSQTFSGMISTLKDGAQQLIGEVVQPISDSMVSTLLPAAIDAIDQLTNAFQTQGVDGLIQAGSQILVNLVTGIAQGLPSLIEIALQIIQSIITNLNANLPQLLAAGGQILLTLASGIISLLPSLLSLGFNLVVNLINGIVSALPQLLAQGNDMLNQYKSTIQSRFPEILQTGLDMITNLLTGLLSNAPQIIEQAGQMLIEWVDIILGMLPDILQSGADMILNLLSGLVANAPQIIVQCAQMLGDFVSTIRSHLPEILQKGIEIIGQLLAGIISEVPNLIAAIPGIVVGVAEAFMDEDWASVGWDIITGVASGVASAAGNLVDAAVSAAEDAVNTVKGWLGIASPSKLMRDEVGKMMALGMGIGFEKNVPTKDMETSLNSSLEKLQTAAGSITASTPVTTSKVVKSVTNNYTGHETDYRQMKKIYKEALNEANERPIVLNGRQLNRTLREEGFVQA